MDTANRQSHLIELEKQQKELLQEIQNLNTTLLQKKELVLKVQGAIEYLQQTGVTISDPDQDGE